MDTGEPVFANIPGDAVDTDGREHSCPGHYLTVVEYQDDGNTVEIADPAVQEYWMDVAELANWIAGRATALGRRGRRPPRAGPRAGAGLGIRGNRERPNLWLIW
ncbi:hypothetical protein [Micromonospora sp. NPDC057140]|uniref:hypothetical protein n=1 Tax=Micromonospora sp. NPDC057140 TaxID=3346032 RepID=UPI0036336FC5